MALKFKLDSLDGLDDATKALYAQTANGKWQLQVEEDDTVRTIRQERNELEKALKAKEKAEEEAKAAAEKAELERKGEYEKLSAQMKAEKEALASELAKEKAEREEHLRESAAISALGAAGLKVNRILLSELKSGLEVVQGKVLVKGDPSQTPESLLTKLRNDPDCAGLFPASGSGAGSPPPGNPKAKAWAEMTLRERSELYKSNPDQAKALMPKG